MRMDLFSTIAALVVLVPIQAEAGLISYFDFNGGATPTGTNSVANTAAMFTVTTGNGSMSSNFDPASITDFNGTTNNAVSGDVAGVALALQDGVSGNATENNGKYLQLNTSTLGNTNIVISFAIQATGTGFQSDQLQYSIDGTNYASFGGPFTPISSSSGFGAAGGVQMFDLSSITGLNNDANASFRIVFNLGTGNLGSSSGNNRIDNLQVTGTAAVTTAIPEPVSIAMVGLGLAMIGAACRRSRPNNTL